MLKRPTISGVVLGAVVLGLAGPVAAARPSEARAPELVSATASTSASASPSVSIVPSGPPHGEYPRDEPTLSPWRVVQGGNVRITAYCANPVGVTAESVVFGKVNLTNVTRDGRGRSTTVRVPSDTKPGEYSVRVMCPDPDGGQIAKLVVYTKKKPTGGAATGGGGAENRLHG